MDYEAEETGYVRRSKFSWSSPSSDDYDEVNEFHQIAATRENEKKMLQQNRKQVAIQSFLKKGCSPWSSSNANSKNFDECAVTNKAHNCSLQETVTLETIAKGMRTMSKQICSLEKFQKDLMSVQLEGKGPERMKAAVPSVAITSDDIFDDEDDERSGWPLKNLDEFKLFEQQLKEKSFFDRVVKLVLVNVELSSVARTARSILRQVMHPALSRHFSWKGKQRRDQDGRKDAFCSLMFTKLIRKCVEITWPRDSEIGRKIEITVSTWLAQQGTVYSKQEKERR